MIQLDNIPLPDEEGNNQKKNDLYKVQLSVDDLTVIFVYSGGTREGSGGLPAGDILRRSSSHKEERQVGL